MRNISLMILAMMAGACTVKEDRTYCPAWCIVYSDGYVAEGCSGDLTCSVSSDMRGSLDFGTKSFSSFTERGNLVFEVPRNENVFLDLFCGVNTMSLSESALRIPMGCGCDGIYSGHGSVLIPGESGEAGLPLHKDFAALRMTLDVNMPERCELYLRILGNVDGYALPGGLPHKGEFDYRPPGDGKLFHARVPRQYDDSLVLEICRQDDDSTVVQYALGQAMSILGYDWNLPDLEDLDIVITLNELDFDIGITPWEESGTINIIL